MEELIRMFTKNLSSYFSIDEFIYYRIRCKSKYNKNFEHKRKIQLWFWFNRNKYRLYDKYLSQGMSNEFAYKKVINKK